MRFQLTDVRAASTTGNVIRKLFNVNPQWLTVHLRQSRKSASQLAMAVFEPPVIQIAATQFDSFVRPVLQGALASASSHSYPYMLSFGSLLDVTLRTS